MVILGQRVDLDTCVKCRKKFKPGDRIVQVYIIDKIGKDPRPPHGPGAFLNDSFEFGHYDCNDVGMNNPIGGSIVTI